MYRTALIGLFLAAPWLGCCICQGPKNVDFVAVREGELRSARFALPLDADARKQLLMYLAAGGDQANIDNGEITTLVYPNAEARWGGLLTLLQNGANVEQADLENGTYSHWFHEPPLHQVVDATAGRPNLACSPSALRHERFVWVFECGAPGRLGAVFVQLDVAERAGR
jgi:hypothetical protein